jgi:Zinc knuckle
VKLQEFEEQPCFLCGETGHRQWECPNTKEEGFKLSEEMQSKVQALYARDIARREVRTYGYFQEPASSCLFIAFSCLSRIGTVASQHAHLAVPCQRHSASSSGPHCAAP